MSNLDLKTTFNNSTELYHTRRPHYPPELFKKLVTDTDLPQDAELLEIGLVQAKRRSRLLGMAITSLLLNLARNLQSRHVKC